MRCDECKQMIFDRAEAIADALHTATSCTGALLCLIENLAQSDAEFARLAGGVLRATDRYVDDARAEADGIARLMMD